MNCEHNGRIACAPTNIKKEDDGVAINFVGAEFYCSDCEQELETPDIDDPEIRSRVDVMIPTNLVEDENENPR